MRKIPTLFEREENYVVPTLNPKAEWVLFEESIAKRKYDGTCCYFDGYQWFSRNAYKGRINQKMDLSLIPVEYDPNTQKTFCWQPMDESPFKKYMYQALGLPPIYGGMTLEDTYYIPGTYECIGPRINKNAEGYSQHRMVNHDWAEQMSDINLLELHTLSEEDAFHRIMDVLSYVEVEGVVFYGPDGKLAKIKRKDFNYGQAT